MGINEDSFSKHIYDFVLVKYKAMPFINIFIKLRIFMYHIFIQN